jgi:dTDP-glucose pyrophosphorylase
MIDRPKLDKNLDGKTFREFYYLKEELVDFCRRYGLPTSGGKLEITERIAHFLDTGEVLTAKRVQKKPHIISDITTDTKLNPILCAQKSTDRFLKNT